MGWIPFWKEQKVEALLGDHSDRAIAKRVGICRATVARIRRQRQPRPDAGRLDEGGEEQAGEHRCGTCGAKVIGPCRACALRRRLGLL